MSALGIDSETEELIELSDIEDHDIDKFGIFIGVVFVEQTFFMA